MGTPVTATPFYWDWTARQDVSGLALTPEGVSRTLNYAVLVADLPLSLFQTYRCVPHNRIYLFYRRNYFNRNLLWLFPCTYQYAPARSARTFHHSFGDIHTKNLSSAIWTKNRYSLTYLWIIHCKIAPSPYKHIALDLLKLLWKGWEIPFRSNNNDRFIFFFF